MSWKNLYAVPKSIAITDIAYAAGLIDGEGCLSITKMKPGQGGRINPSHRFYMKVTIGQRHVAEWLRNTFQAGSVTIQKHKHYNDGYNWCVASLQAIAILNVIRPYLKIKGKEADIAFEFAQSYWQRGSSVCLSPKVIKKRERLYHRMQQAKPSYRFRHPK